MIHIGVARISHSAEKVIMFELWFLPVYAMLHIENTSGVLATLMTTNYTITYR